ncbi:hypothetical protein OG777_11585 [Micromonospora peucetia]|uniref:MYXO-CTERM domain-containing protein n=1 Tax=Micromonospora peucetia TaxID=47871 RepID=A0ABZ1EKY4_9ACTN|nr:hypothetical protein [Micromonospora peucetia]MCX4387570.1 hypothetical protein [Micromonospora peucetia]WSA34891.1 hypothetical protein OIE14_13010 [Micromonospora peucetia]
MAMVNQPAARRHHRSRIAYAFGLLALIGAAITLVVVVRDPALSSTTRLTTPVPAPEITVVDEDPPDDGPDALDAPYALTGPDESDALDATDDPGPVAAGADVPAGSRGGPAQAARPSPDDVRQSLFWSGIFGLAISLAGLGLIGTRRRMW